MSTSFLVHFQKDEIILHEGEQQKIVYKLVFGTVAFHTNYGKINHMRVGERTAPDYFGEIMLLVDVPTYCTIVAENAVTALRVSEEDFDNFLQRDAQNPSYIVGEMADNLQMAQIYIDRERLLQEIAQAATQVVMDLNILRSLVQPEISARLAIHFGRAGSIANAEKEHILQELYLPGHKDYSDVLLPDCTEFLYEKEYTCPHCKQPFEGVCIASMKLIPVYGSYEEERYDFRMIYRDFCAEWYDIVTCPHCYFSAFSDTFRTDEIPSKGRYAARLAEIRAALPTDFWKEQTLARVFTQHYLALVCAEAFQNELMSKAQIWQNISWLYEDQKDTELHEAALQRTMDAYKEVYSYCDLTPAQMQRIFLIIADILYHKGKRQAARRWLMQTKMLREGKPIYVNMADKLIQIIREEIDEERYELERTKLKPDVPKKPKKSLFGSFYKQEK